MTLRVVRLGSTRGRGEGLRIGTARRPPRGVKKKDYARLDYYDAWLPELAPSQKLVSWAMAQPLEGARWSNFSVGCYCEDEKRCHRSILPQLLAEHGARLARS